MNGKQKTARDRRRRKAAHLDTTAPPIPGSAKKRWRTEQVAKMNQRVAEVQTDAQAKIAAAKAETDAVAKHAKLEAEAADRVIAQKESQIDFDREKHHKDLDDLRGDHQAATYRRRSVAAHTIETATVRGNRWRDAALIAWVGFPTGIAIYAAIGALI